MSWQISHHLLLASSLQLSIIYRFEASCHDNFVVTWPRAKIQEFVPDPLSKKARSGNETSDFSIPDPFQAQIMSGGSVVVVCLVRGTTPSLTSSSVPHIVFQRSAPPLLAVCCWTSYLHFAISALWWGQQLSAPANQLFCVQHNYGSVNIKL